MRKPDPPPSGPGIGPWEICEDPHCNHTSHGSLRRVASILFGIQARIRRENPEKWAQMVAQAKAELAAREAAERAAAGGES